MCWLQRMMADAPRYTTENKSEPKELKPQDAEAFAAMINDNITE